MGGGLALAAPVVEPPTPRWLERGDVTFAELTGARTVVRRHVEPDDQLLVVERERCRGRGTTSGSRTQTRHDDERYLRSRTNSWHPRAASRTVCGARLAHMPNDWPNGGPNGGPNGWIVRVPASSANLGAAFDAVAVALGTHLEVRTGGGSAAPETHPAVRAFRHAGGEGPLSVRAHFPGGRGLGVSGAARVAGGLAAAAPRGRPPPGAPREAPG